jgi:hypothetical protein
MVKITFVFVHGHRSWLEYRVKFPKTASKRPDDGVARIAKWAHKNASQKIEKRS